MMTTKSVHINKLDSEIQHSKKILKIMTIIAWTVLSIGVVLCLTNISQLNDRNWGLMIGIGFLVGSVFIYTIGTAIGLVHSRAFNEKVQSEDD